MKALFVACLAAVGGQASAQDWRPLTVPPADRNQIIVSNPLQGYYSYEYPGIVPQSPPAADLYLRFGWAEIEKGEGQYDFARIDDRLKALKPGQRIAIAIMPMNTCCSANNGADVPDYVVRHQDKGFWIKADPGNYGHVEKVYVPDWNDAWYQQRWRALWMALGARYNGDARIAWVELRSYGNWGEGHLAGAGAYNGSNIPYDNPAVNVHGALPGSEASRFALVDAIMDAFPQTQKIAMTDDKATLVHALKRSRAIGMRRDSWGATWFEDGLFQGVPEADKALVRDRWKTAPFIVESFGWTRAFEVGLPGLVRQIEQYHVSAIGNGNFNVAGWGDLSAVQQAALIRAGNRAGYRYVPVAAAYRSTVACPLLVRMTWRNDGVAPAYGRVRLHIRAEGTQTGPAADIPAILPGQTYVTLSCLALPPGPHRLAFALTDADGTEIRLPLKTRALGKAFIRNR